MKCPFCAETIQDEARKCRFCGETITKAAQAGFPAFYIETTEAGLIPWALVEDYGRRADPEKGFGMDGSMFGPGDWMGAIRRDINDEDFVTMSRRESRAFVDGINERLRDYGVGTEEAKVLNIVLKFLRLCEHTYSATRNRSREGFEAILAELHPLREEASTLDPSIQKDWLQLIDLGIADAIISTTSMSASFSTTAKRLGRREVSKMPLPSSRRQCEAASAMSKLLTGE